MSGKQAFDAQRGKHFYIDPRRVIIPGRDTPHKSRAEHPLWTESANDPEDTNLTANIKHLGVLEAVKIRRNGLHDYDWSDRVWDPRANNKAGGWVEGYIWREGDKLYEVVDGRHRTVSTRAAFEQASILGLVPPLLKVEIVEGDEDRHTGILISSNEHRRDTSLLDRARQATELLAKGQSEHYVCTLFGVKKPTLTEWQRLVGLAKPVQKAVAAGRVAATTAVALDRFSHEKQVEKLQQILAKSPNKRVTRREVERTLEGKNGSAPIRLTRGRVKKLLEDAEWTAERSPDAQAILRFLAGEEDAIAAIPGLAERLGTRQR